MPNSLGSVSAAPVASTKPGAALASYRLLLVGDGYDKTAKDKAKFDTHCKDLVSAITSAPWWIAVKSAAPAREFSIYKMQVTSDDTGIQNEPGGTGRVKSTYFNSTYVVGGPLQYLLWTEPVDAISPTDAARAEAKQQLNLDFNAVAILANSEAYGASTAPDRSFIRFAAAGSKDQTAGLFFHEFGHLMALEDEYFYEDANGKSPKLHYRAVLEQPNVDEEDNDRANIKWAASIDPGTILPCVNVTGAKDPTVTPTTVGTFAGGAHFGNAYRSMELCRMLHSSVEFCDICKAHIVSQLD